MSVPYQLPRPPRGVTPYDWALRQLRVPRAHAITSGDEQTVIALIDIGYRHHRALDGHLWDNPQPAKGDLHGWDFVNNDDTLAYTGPGEDTNYYYRGHHVFVAGEIAAVAPQCKIMILVANWLRPESMSDAIRYAVDHGARVLAMPHGYLTGGMREGGALFYRGTDFTYPDDYPDLRLAMDEAYDAGCVIFKGTADNRGRRVAVAGAALESVVAVGSTNRTEEAADICCSSDYVEVAAPGGQRESDDDRDRIWGYGGDNNIIPFTGGCMACGFAAGVAGLVWSRYPYLTNDQVRQVLRNTARGNGWNDYLGWGILDAARAVSMQEDQLSGRLRVDRRGCSYRPADSGCGKPVLRVALSNVGAVDVRRAVVVVYDGDPRKPAAPSGSIESPIILKTRQVGHVVTGLRGLDRVELDIELAAGSTSSADLSAGSARQRVWIEAYIADRHGPDEVVRTSIPVT